MHNHRQLPRCPYASAGLDEDVISRCALYKPARVLFEVTGTGGDTPSQELAAGTSCAHLGLQPGTIDFSFVSACHHPKGPPPVAVIERVGRGGGHPAAAPSPA
ncbi:MAG: hypothetical protein JO198_12885 [Candidatus Dormibacteraeota bacterium]|nr:hypothetical protein [Candidatus Dormibacteraeota bacterium]